MAYSYNVPLSYTINVSLSQTLQGLADFNTNSIAIFTNEPAAFSADYQVYITPAPVATDFGSNSLTYAMANGLFTPVPNLRTGNGYLYVFPFKGVNATSGSFTTADISDNVTAFKSVANGTLSITIDGETQILNDLDFTSIKSIDDIVTVLKNRNLDVDITVNENTIVFTSRRAGTASAVILAVQDTTDGTDIAGSSYLMAASGSTSAGANASGETLAEAVAAAMQKVYFGGVLTTQITDDTTRLVNATAIQLLDCVYYDSLKSLDDIISLGADIKAAGLSKTRTLAYSMNNGKVAAATYASIAKSVNYNGTATANTLNLKTLTGVLGDTNLSDTYVLAAKANGVDIYGNTGGLNVVYSNDNNGYTDDVENQLWIKKAIEIAGFNYLRQTTTKIPQTEAGMTGLKNAYAQICEKAINNGVAAPGEWNTAVPFGDPETFVRNIREKGYYIYSIPVAKQAQAERENRQAPVVQIAIKLAGAIHSSEIIITIER